MFFNFETAVLCVQNLYCSDSGLQHGLQNNKLFAASVQNSNNNKVNAKIQFSSETHLKFRKTPKVPNTNFDIPIAPSFNCLILRINALSLLQFRTCTVVRFQRLEHLLSRHRISISPKITNDLGFLNYELNRTKKLIPLVNYDRAAGC